MSRRREAMAEYFDKRHLAEWRAASDDQRAEWRGPGMARLIDFWELIRAKRVWMRASDFASWKSPQLRWVRRQIKYFAAAGLVEVRGGGTGTPLEFRRKMGQL